MIKVIVFIGLILICTNSCYKINQNRNFDINGVQFELPERYSLQLIDSLNKEWMITNNNCNILIINSGGELNYKPLNAKESPYSYFIDTLQGFNREIFFNKQNSKAEFNIIIGHSINKDLNSFSRLNKALGIDNKDRDSINYEIIFSARSYDDRYCIEIKNNDIDTLMKYFSKATIRLKK